MFYACNNADKLESDMNDWLGKNPEIQITGRLMQATGRMDHHVTVVIFYREGAQ